jgi:hypothetical protein
MHRRVFRPHVALPSNGRLPSSWFRLLLVICILIPATAGGAEEKASSRDVGQSAVAPPPENSSKSPDSVVDCSKAVSRLSDHPVCADMPARTPTVQVPEPSSLFLVGCGLLFMAALLRHRFVRIRLPEGARRL